VYAIISRHLARPRQVALPSRSKLALNFGSPAIPMKTALLRSGTTENPLENEDRRARWWPWITESAGEPDSDRLQPEPVVLVRPKVGASDHGFVRCEKLVKTGGNFLIDDDYDECPRVILSEVASSEPERRRVASL